MYMSTPVETIDLGMVNAYLLAASDGFVLVDTGLPNMWESLESHLKDSGCLPGRLKLVAITHGDPDHAGSCAKLQKRYGATIGINEADAPQVEKGIQLKREIRNPIFRVMMFLRRRRMRKRMPAFETFTPDLFLSDGRSLSEWGVDARVLHLPGHTPGSIAILTGEGDLLAGDLVSNMLGKPGPSPFVHDREQMRASLEKLKGMDLKTIYPGHGKAFPASELRKIDV
jgi:glyoxylase-like metal-dependent hydrolase (beta-lactamase superfamily II)